MRKAVLLVSISVVLVASLLFIWGVPTLTVDKRLDSSLPVTKFIQGGVDHGDVQEWAQWWSLHHSYVMDNVRLETAEGQYLPLMSDFWLFPSEVETLVKTYGTVFCDCEDGSIKGTADLIANGQDAWLCVGWLEMDGVWYGHAWIEVGDDLIETTTSPAVVVEGRPDIYRLCWRNNATRVIRYPNVAAPANVPTLPVELVTKLRQQLQG